MLLGPFCYSNWIALKREQETPPDVVLCSTRPRPQSLLVASFTLGKSSDCLLGMSIAHLLVQNIPSGYPLRVYCRNRAPRRGGVCQVEHGHLPCLHGEDPKGAASEGFSLVVCYLVIALFLCLRLIS